MFPRSGTTTSRQTRRSSMNDSPRRESFPSRWLAAVDASGIAMLWIGMILAIGLAAGTKFQAPGLTMPVALDVGRHVFAAFGHAELALVAVLCVATWLRRERAVVWWLVGVVVGLVAIQAFWLRPALDARALAIIAGEPVGESWFHLGYVGAEGMKVIGLLWIATVARRR